MRKPSLVLALGAMALTVLACGGHSPAPQLPTAVKAASVGRAEAPTEARYSAEIQPATRVDLAFKVGGYVDSIVNVKGVESRPHLLQEGDAVREGTELAALRKADFSQKFEEAKAALAQALAAQEQAQVTFERTTRLVSAEVAPPAQLDAARTQRDSTAGRSGSRSATRRWAGSPWRRG